MITHFVALGMGLAVVNGCVPVPRGLIAKPVTDLPSVTYHVVHQPSATDDPRVTALLEHFPW